MKQAFIQSISLFACEGPGVRVPRLHHDAGGVSKATIGRSGFSRHSPAVFQPRGERSSDSTHAEWPADWPTYRSLPTATADNTNNGIILRSACFSRRHCLELTYGIAFDPRWR